ncbi:phytanoyl-CoA dioxygenase family protein [Saccharomonospora azurea]|uniref:Phytanoyl-CoA dioxygenase (PhyH) n=1 Tax=Saccharomonospora azurea NA-128 TaxID=882081 RepID=H8GBL4_9PSEU|nr:phytanoyl-CoA dioxygenase family protein [Saccharomonospora azurea]EHY88698.1 Phytanoyl-CoA dioxygenase (PhyH) [Saccharomonospora azurea NA-128]
MALRTEQVEQFVRDGFVKLDGAFPVDIGERCVRELWDATGCSRTDPATWTQPVVRLGGFSTPPFREAATTPTLHEAFDALVGVGRWQPLGGLGTFPVRFPSDEDPGDAGWHVEAGYAGPNGEFWLDHRSQGRALLLLFLFSEVGPDDAPTRIRVGSHLDVPPLLEPAGDDGRKWLSLCHDAVEASAHRPVALATGTVGDVYVCHPFLVHGAQPHRGRTPRFMAQPPLVPVGALDPYAAEPNAVERAMAPRPARRPGVTGRTSPPTWH